MGPSASYSITVRLTNALRVAGKKLPEVRVAMAGAGAAGTAVLKLLLGAGASAGDIVVCDDRGPCTWPGPAAVRDAATQQADRS